MSWPDALDEHESALDADIAEDNARACKRSALLLLVRAAVRLYSAANNPSRPLAMQDVCDASDYLHGAGRLLPVPQCDAVTDMAERLDADLRGCWSIPYATVDELMPMVAAIIDALREDSR